MDWRWAAACVQRAGRGHIVSPRAQIVTMGDQLDELYSFSGSLPYLYFTRLNVSGFCSGK